MLDTSAYSAFLRAHEGVKLSVQRADEIHLSPVSLGELHSGFRLGAHCEKNERELRFFLSSPRVAIPRIDHETALRYAEIVLFLRRAGTPVPTNDIWIAAQAMEHGLTVVTTDEHYLRIPQIIVEHYRP